MVPLAKFSISDLSDDEVRSVVQILARRPNHGIAYPARQWLEKQEAKVRKLPPKLQRPRNPLKCVFIRIFEKLEMADPNAILCSAHWDFHPKMVRPLFMNITYEVSSRSNRLRNWPHLGDHPVLAAFVDRLNSVSAYWLQKEVYQKLIGGAPYDPAIAYVDNNCEACILAAIGANGSVLCDLRAILLDRVERDKEAYERLRPNWSNARPPARPRLLRFVEKWINCLSADDDLHVRAKCDQILEELRKVRRPVRRWWVEQKSKNRKAAMTEVTSLGDRQTVSAVQRKSKNGIIVANIDYRQQDELRDVAEAYRKSTGQDRPVYRDDTVVNWAEEYVLRPGDRLDLPNGPRSELAGDDGIRVTPMSPDTSSSSQGKYVFADDEIVEQLEEQDPEMELKSREKVHDWYNKRISQSVLGLPNENQKEGAATMLSGIHPALRGDSSRKSAAQSDRNKYEFTEEDEEGEYVPPRNHWSESAKGKRSRRHTEYYATGDPQSVLNRRRKELLDNQSAMLADSKSRTTARNPGSQAGTTISRPASTWETVYMESEVSKPPISRAKSMGSRVRGNYRDDEEACEDESDTETVTGNRRTSEDRRRRNRRATVSHYSMVASSVRKDHRASHSNTSKKPGDDENTLTSFFSRGLQALTGSGSRRGRDKDTESHRSRSKRTDRRARSHDSSSRSPSGRRSHRASSPSTARRRSRSEHNHRYYENSQRHRTSGEVSRSGKYRGRYGRPDREDEFRDSGFASAGAGGGSTRCSENPHPDRSSSCDSNNTSNHPSGASASRLRPPSQSSNRRSQTQGKQYGGGSSAVSGRPLPPGAYEDPDYEECVVDDNRSDMTWGFDGHSRIAALEPSDSASNHPAKWI